MLTVLSLAGTYTVFFFFLTLEADKSESKTFNKVGPENSTWKNYLSDKFQSYSEYACAVPDMTFMKDPGVRCAARDLDFFHQLPVLAAWCNKNKKCPKQHILAWETCPTLRAFLVRKLRRILCTVELWVGYFGASPRAMTCPHHKPGNSMTKSSFSSFIWYMMLICCG